VAQPRKIDYEEALELRGQGWTPDRLADRYGVTANAVWLMLRRHDHPELADRDRERHKQWQRDHHRKPCKGGCGALVWTHGKNPVRSGYCARCLAERLYGKDMRPGELRCTVCRRWKPDEEFHRRAGEAHEGGLRRGRRGQCRACESEARAERRHRRRVPCARCGRPRSHPDDLRRPGSKDTGLCLECLGASGILAGNLRRGRVRRRRRRLRARPLGVRRPA
jgi:hypothetical protein